MAKNKALNDTFNAGKDALAAKNYDAAIEAFQKGVDMDPNQNVIWANLADAYVGQAGNQDRRRSAGRARQSGRSLSQGDRAEAGKSPPTTTTTRSRWRKPRSLTKRRRN